MKCLVTLTAAVLITGMEGQQFYVNPDAVFTVEGNRKNVECPTLISTSTKYVVLDERGGLNSKAVAVCTKEAAKDVADKLWPPK